jgi:peroxiredoxin
MRSKHLLYTFIVLTGLVACSSNNRKFTIIGNFNNLPEQTIILEQLNANDQITIIDSTHIDSVHAKKDGHFELSGIAPEPGLYRLHFTANKFILLSIDKGNIKLEGDWNKLENYTVNGSVESKDLKNFVVAIREHLRDFNSMSIVLDSLQGKGNDSLFSIAKADFQDMRMRFTQFVERYADTTHFQPNAIFAARILNPVTEANYLEAFSQSLGRRFPSTRMAKDYAEYHAKVSEKRRQLSARNKPANEGEQAPEITLPDGTGKTVTLSSFRGKFVLVDFWASWCGPCRGENPVVVAAYNRFKDRNFTILGVSLDNNKDAWQKAIKDDGLIWTQVSDLKGWTSAAAVAYSVQSIPANFLIDPNGKIIARNLRGNQLEETLQEAFKTPANDTAKAKH